MQLARTIRDGTRIVWIVVAVAAVLIVTGIAFEFQTLTVTGLAASQSLWRASNNFFQHNSGMLSLTRPFD
ncbi:hypothetical protein E6H34_05360 [Candidatus Bathyarchaeota archaeon]|nr:MAG: hypothetical protein E6H34_05360 [Candidatus Bathyarchaeota archaeon]